MKGKLLHATNGYKAVAARLFGHKCEEGRNYPPLVTENDSVIHEALTAACLGDTNAIEFTENGNIWELTAAPLRIEGQGLAGIVIRIASEVKGPVQSEKLQPIIQSDPDILNTIPFRAAMADKKGEILAVNKFLASCVRSELVGRNIVELVTPEVDTELTHALMTRSGSVECTMPDISDDEVDATRNIRLHATPSEWDGKEAVMLTFEDITEAVRDREQLKRLLTVDKTTGLLNRQGIEQAISRKFHEFLNDAEHLSLVMIRVDNYRIIQEAKGFTSTQKIIREFTKILLECNGLAGRWSEDEFAIIARCSPSAAVAMVNELRGKSEDVVLSAGVAGAADGGFLSASEFIGAAYDALTEAVNAGGNTTVQSHS